MFTVDSGVVNSSDFQIREKIFGNFAETDPKWSQIKRPEIQATFFFGLAPSSARTRQHPALRAAPAAQCPNHVRARWPDRKVLRVRRGGRLERRRGCGRVAERHAWPPWGPRGTPSPSRTQSPGAARRRAAGAQRAGEPIGGKAARPRAPPRPAYSQWPPSASPPRSPSQAYPRPRKRTRSGCLRSGWSFLSERRVR